MGVPLPQAEGFTISGNIVDLVGNAVFPGTVAVRGGRIAAITRDSGPYATCLLPGFIDAHVHIESSMLPPSEFARLAVRHGTVATVSDPHEIANVLGAPGVEYMLADGAGAPCKFFFGAPSCVPATAMEEAGAVLGIAEVGALLERPEIRYLSEMMDYPGVLNGDPEVLGKIQRAQQLGKVIDGHAPGLRGELLRRYIAAGISTDHETLALPEAREKLNLGMKIIIREGSSARIFDDFMGLIAEFPDRCLLCSDDKHPDALTAGHIADQVRRALAAGLAPLDVLRCASLNPVRHYGLDVGLLQPGDPADFLVVDDLRQLTILQTYINGRLAAERGEPLFGHAAAEQPNRFAAIEKRVPDFAVRAAGRRMRVIEAHDAQLLTSCLFEPPCVEADHAVADPARDLLKIALVNRYRDVPPVVGFVKNFGLRRGAMASSVAHDSHHVVAVGASDADLCAAVNMVIAHRGGLACVAGQERAVLPLPIAGLMSADDGFSVARQYAALDRMAKMLGSPLSAPFMTLSFMALPVIPALKLCARGLFDVERFAVVGLFAE